MRFVKLEVFNRDVFYKSVEREIKNQIPVEVSFNNTMNDLCSVMQGDSNTANTLVDISTIKTSTTHNFSGRQKIAPTKRSRKTK